MGYPELDINLTPEQKSMRDMARKFGAEVIRPIGIALDQMPNPADVIAPGSPLWDAARQFRALGLHRRGLPKSVGGMREDMDPLSQFLIGEALSYADAGMTTTLGGGASTFAFAAMSPDPELQGWARDFCADTSGQINGCWAITEPDHGSDWASAVDNRNADPRIGPTLKAVLKGDEYILTGQKAAWVSNGTIATHATLHVGLDPALGMQGTGLCVLPLSLPGISKGAPLNKIGLRPLNQGEIFFEEVRIPKKYMIVSDPNLMSRGLLRTTLTTANTGMSISFAGLAWAAFDEAHAYARQRVQGGLPIIQHQNIRLKLHRMYMMVHAARCVARQTVRMNAANPPGSLLNATAAKVLSTETAFQVASEAVQIHGGNGLTKEYLIEKLFRDARAGLIMDGTNEALALGGTLDLMD